MLLGSTAYPFQESNTAKARMCGIAAASTRSSSSKVRMWGRRRCLRSSRNSTSRNGLSLMSILRSANFIIRWSTARSRFTVAVRTPSAKRFSLNSSITSDVMSESFIVLKHPSRLRTDDLYRFCVFGCWTVSRKRFAYSSKRGALDLVSRSLPSFAAPLRMSRSCRASLFLLNACSQIADVLQLCN